MDADLKEGIGTLMRVLAGGEVSRAEVEDLSFEAASAELQAALNEAFLKLLEFAYDREARRAGPGLDRKMRSALQHNLAEITRLAT